LYDIADRSALSMSDEAHEFEIARLLKDKKVIVNVSKAPARRLASNSELNDDVDAQQTKDKVEKQEPKAAACGSQLVSTIELPARSKVVG
jgi:hypothetical protein